MAKRALLPLLLLSSCLLCSTAAVGTLRCDRTISGIAAAAAPEISTSLPPLDAEEHHYRIEVSGNPVTYIPGDQYTVFLRSDVAGEKFQSFILTLEAEGDVVQQGSSIGSLQLYGDSSTKFSSECPNAIVETDTNPKSEIQVLWSAPGIGSGKASCVAFKAAIVLPNGIGYGVEGPPLTKILCPESQDSQDVQPPIQKHCCACDEAKYESEHIRTIVKARGMSYPNITGKTFAVFRVDNRHHLMSIVSMIDPSPDWIVGVSSLELCLANCSWAESKVLNLYPWDAGTDDGITYMSPNQASSPRQPIKRIRSNFPNDPRSPFYDPKGDSELKPLARLYISRQRLYEKICHHPNPDDSSSSSNEEGSVCETEEWSPWSPCSATCGRGVKYKQRRYKIEESKYTCHKKLTERAGCEAIQRYCPHHHVKEAEDPMCEVGPWGEWSSCSVSCGKGVQTRDRRYKNRLAAKICALRKASPPLLQQTLECWGTDKCVEDDYEEEESAKEDSKCPKLLWSDWSPCSVTCGKGFKARYRLAMSLPNSKNKHWPFYRNSYNYYEESSDEATDFENLCFGNRKHKETVECFQKPCLDENKIKGFNKGEAIAISPYNIQNDDINTESSSFLPHRTLCRLTKWSEWGNCIPVTGSCGNGNKTKRRHFKHPQHAIKECPEKPLIKTRKCQKACSPKIINN